MDGLITGFAKRYEMDLPFVAVDDNLVAFLLYGRSDVCRVRRGDWHVISV